MSTVILDRGMDPSDPICNYSAAFDHIDLNLDFEVIVEFCIIDIEL